MSLGVLIAGCLLTAPVARSAIEPETMGRSTLGEPASTWVIIHSAIGPAYVVDSANGAMLGLLSLSPFTPAVSVNLDAQEIYAAESYYSRGVHGTRTDVLTIYDLATLGPAGEVEIPQKIAALPFPQYIERLSDDRHVAIFNLTPAMSVSIVDVAERTFVEEISTPGCALIMGVRDRGFLQICGDGRLQLIRLDDSGREASRTRSDPFFSVEEDPVFDKPVRTSSGWLLSSYGGQVFDVTVDGDDIEIAKPWSLLTDADVAAGWRPGGGQFIALHEAQDLLFVLMNADGEFSHDNAGSEVWVFDRGAKRRVGRLVLEAPGGNLFVSQDATPLLSVAGEDGQLHVYDVATLKHLRSVAEVGTAPGLLQGFNVQGGGRR